MILLLVLYFVALIALASYGPRPSARSNRTDVAPRIACLVIVSTKSPRWRMEMEYWQRREVPPNVDKYLLQCGGSTSGDSNVVVAQCDERAHKDPGIYQKSLHGLRAAVRKGYDMYIRTNANTFIDFERLNEVPIGGRTPVYSGAYFFKWGVSGTSIVLNHAAALRLLEVGFEPRYYDWKYPDDVAIADVLKSLDILPIKKGMGLYVWNFKRSLEENERARRERNCAFVRTTHSPSIESQRQVYDFLSASLKKK